MDMSEVLALWVSLQTLENWHDPILLRPAREPRGIDPIENHKIVLQLGLLEAAEQTTPVRHNPFVFRRPFFPEPVIQEDAFVLNFSTFFNLRKPNRRSKKM